jgi:DNA-binding response OmpR family regulator
VADNLVRASAVLAITACEEDRAVLGRILCPPEWDLCAVRSCQEAWTALMGTRFAAVISDSEFPDGLDWKEVLRQTLEIPERPPLIVTSRLADDRLWAEVLNLGGFDLLLKPLDGREVLYVVGRALRPGRSRG